MESLIKGLINVAIGHDEDDQERRSSPPRDERSRSTWAQVVSEEHDNEEASGERRHAYGSNQPNNEEENDGRTGVWGSRPPSQPHKVVSEEHDNEEPSGERRHAYGRNQPNNEGEEGNSDGWETVGKKPSKQSHKVQKNQWNNFKRPASEQEFSEEVSYGVNFSPSEEELNDLSKACEKLWELDLNRLVPNKDYEIDIGEGKKVYQKHDMAQGTLFSWLNEDVFTKPTISRFCSLLDNYNPQAGCKEVVTNQELQEQSAFIEEISRTAPIKYLHEYLSLKGVVSEDSHEFKRFLSGFWFDLYGRGGTYGSSSAFEHVFVGELKNCGEQQVSGFHNWLQFYMEESKGRVDYQGYIFPRRRGEIPDTETQLLTIQFEWNGVLKSVSSTLVGVSPEFEIALYTLCYYMGGEENYVQLGPYSVNIKCYRIGNKIGSAFPIAEC